MPKIRLSRSTVDKLDYSGKQVEYFDTKITGFGVRVNRTSKTYFVQCRIKDQKNKNGDPLEIKESLGKVDIVDYENALNRAKAILENAANGIAPDDIRRQIANLESEKVRELQKEERKDVTLQNVFEEYIKTKKKLKASTIVLYQEDIDRYIPHWKDIPLRSIDGNMVIEQHAIIGKRSKARADGTMRIVRAIFNHAIHMYDDIIYRNPVAKLSAVNGWHNVPRKESYVKPSELKRWLPAVLKLGYDTTQDFILMLLFCGSRKTETSTLRWKDVNLQEGTAVFRETKTGTVLEVPLCRFILDRLEARKEFYYNGTDSFIFPSYGESGHITDARAALDVVRNVTGIRSTHHDLRRSFISYCEELEITLFSRKRLANHAIPLDVTEGYTFHSMEKLRKIVEQIAEFILSNAGMPYNGQDAPTLSDEQSAKITNSEFWQSLYPEQQKAFLALQIPVKEKTNVIDLEEVKIKRRMFA